MVENVEQIEAKLAAYIDGELTADERDELERHLEANPSHRALIRELSGHRDLLRALPRECAPADLSEPLESAMERDALLGGGDPLTEFKIVRNRRWWPQLLAAAAIFVLAFGLGAIVFYVLPPKHPTVSIVQPPETDEVAQEKEAGKETPVVAQLEVADLPEQLAQRPEAESQFVTGGARLTDRASNVLLKQAEGAAMAADAAGSETAPLSAKAAAETLVITITAENVQQASTELLNYFATNGITWSEAGSPEAIAWVSKDVVAVEQGVSLALGGVGAAGMAAGGGGGDAGAPADESRALKVASQQMEKQDAAVLERATARTEEVAASTPRPAPSENFRSRRAAVRDESGSGAMATASVPTTQPVALLERQQRESLNQTPPAGAAGALANAAAQEAKAQTDHYVVLAALDGRQAQRLTDVLARPTFGRRAEVRREPLVLPTVTSARRAPAVQAPTRGVRVGLTSESAVLAESLRPDGEEFKLVRPATQPVDTAELWSVNDAVATEGVNAPATRPSQPFSFQSVAAGRELDAAIFNCVVVLRRPQVAAPVTQPVATPAAPATQPVR